MKKNLLITAGLGTQEFNEASRRVRIQAQHLWKSLDVLELNNQNLKELCPVTFTKYGEFMNLNTVGFGFMAWKAEVVCRALNLNFGSYETIIWADSGCEIQVNLISKARFMIWIVLARIYGVVAFTLRTPENKYTKRDLFDFLNLDNNDSSPQFQTTFFILNGDKGKLLADRWFEIVASDIRFVNEDLSQKGEIDGFSNHRHDQSVFSIVAKSMNIHPLIRPLPNGKAKGFRKLRSFSYPVWAARNRTGISIQSPAKLHI